MLIKPMACGKFWHLPRNRAKATSARKAFTSGSFSRPVSEFTLGQTVDRTTLSRGKQSSVAFLQAPFRSNSFCANWVCSNSSSGRWVIAPLATALFCSICDTSPSHDSLAAAERKSANVSHSAWQLHMALIGAPTKNMEETTRFRFRFWPWAWQKTAGCYWMNWCSSKCQNVNAT